MPARLNKRTLVPAGPGWFLGALAAAAFLDARNRPPHPAERAPRPAGVLLTGALLLKGLTMAAAALLDSAPGPPSPPGLYLAGFPLSSQIIGQVFALVELVRSLADYIMAPVMVQIARESSATVLDAHGVHFGLWMTVMLTIGFTVLGTTLYLLGRPGLQRPDLEGWLANQRPAIRPKPLLARLRRIV